MSDKDTDAVVEDSPLGLSDADFMAMDVPSFEDFPTNTEEETVTSEEGTQDEEQSEVEDESEAEFEESEETSNSEEEEESDTLDEGDDGDGETDDDSSTGADAQIAALFAPFKANGKEMQIDSIDDARTLMQRGANYNKKMAALKPNLKVLKTLENNDLLDPEKINYLIDLDKKNPEAIRKLIKESQLGIADLDIDEDVEYSPSNHAASDKEMELDDVLEAIRDTPSYQRTSSLVATEWDDASKQKFAKEPSRIAVINAQIQSGVFDQITAQVEKEQALGKLGNLSDIDAYEMVGNAMLAQGLLGTPEGQSSKPRPKRNVAAKTNAKEEQRRQRKQSASPSKSSKPVVTEDFNPLSMSDDEIAKISDSKFL